MAGEINFGLHDPNAFLTGATTMNKMMGNLAKKRAGKKMAEGDLKGGVNELYREGMIEEGQATEHNATANAAGAWGLDESKRKSNAEMARDVATSLDNVRMQHGDGAVLPAFEQLLPVFRAQGVPEEAIQKYREGLSQNPGAFIAGMSRNASDYLKRYEFRTTADGIFQTDKYTGRVTQRVKTPRYFNVPRDSTLVSPESDPQNQPEDDQGLYDNPNVIDESGAYGGLAQPREGRAMDEGMGRGDDPRYSTGYRVPSAGPAGQPPAAGPGASTPQSGIMSMAPPPGLSPLEWKEYKEYIEQVQQFQQGDEIDPSKIDEMPYDGSPSQMQTLPADPNQPAQIRQLQAPGGAGGGMVAPRALGGARVIAEGRQTPRAQYRELTPQEAQQRGFRPGTKVQQNSTTGQLSVVQGPPSASSAAGAGGKPAKLSVQELSELSKARTELTAARGLIPLMDEFVKINEKADTGGAYTMVGPGLPGSETAARMLGGDPVQRMMTITSRMTPAMRQGLPGAASDRDVALFQDATVGIGKSRKVNAQIRDMTKAMIIRSGDFLAFKEAYARANNTLLGAQEKWDEYVDANPLFEQSGEGLPKLRKVVPWRNVIDTSMPDDGSAGGGAEDDVDALLEKYK